MKKTIIFGIIFLLTISFVSAVWTITPQTNSLTTYVNQEMTFTMNVKNENPFTIYNCSFSPLTGFTFPTISQLTPNQSQTITYAVKTNAIFDQVYISTASYLYEIYSPPPTKVVIINITDSGFQPQTTTIMTGDSIQWTNKMTQDTGIADFGTGFPSISNIPALQSTLRTYNSIANYQFYKTVGGQSGYLIVQNRTTTGYAHDSMEDKQLIFNVHSVLPSTSLDLNLLTNNIPLDNNQTYNGIMEIRNNEDILINTVHLSADKWISNFSENDFNLNPNSNKLIYYNLTPFVTRTNETNRTQIVKMTLTSGNAGNITKDLSVFIHYANLDMVNINGINYTITLLGWNETIEVCLAHMNDVGFEKCKELEKYFTKNETRIVEIPAQYKLTEQEVLDWKAKMNTIDAVSERLENKMNLYVDKQNAINEKVDNMTIHQENQDKYINNTLTAQSKEQSNQNKRYWLTLTIVILLTLLGTLVWIIDNIKYIECLIRAGQL